MIHSSETHHPVPRTYNPVIVRYDSCLLACFTHHVCSPDAAELPPRVCGELLSVPSGFGVLRDNVGLNLWSPQGGLLTSHPLKDGRSSLSALGWYTAVVFTRGPSWNPLTC